MKKRILASFLSLCMLLTLLPTVALAAYEYPHQDWEKQANGVYVAGAKVETTGYYNITCGESSTTLTSADESNYDIYVDMDNHTVKLNGADIDLSVTEQLAMGNKTCSVCGRTRTVADVWNYGGKDKVLAITEGTYQTSESGNTGCSESDYYWPRGYSGFTFGTIGLALMDGADWTLTLEGSSTIDVATEFLTPHRGSLAYATQVHGVYSRGDLTINGTGVLTANATNNCQAPESDGWMSNLSASGIYAGGDLTINSGTINAKVDAESIDMAGMSVDYPNQYGALYSAGNMTITSTGETATTVNAVSDIGAEMNGTSAAIMQGNLYGSEATALTISGDNTSVNASASGYAGGVAIFGVQVNITGGEVEATSYSNDRTAAESASTSMGIYGGSVSITGGTVEANADTCAIGGEQLTVSAGEVEASCTSNSGSAVTGSTVSLSTGTYNTALPSEYLAENCGFVDGKVQQITEDIVYTAFIGEYGDTTNGFTGADGGNRAIASVTADDGEVWLLTDTTAGRDSLILGNKITVYTAYGVYFYGAFTGDGVVAKTTDGGEVTRDGVTYTVTVYEMISDPAAASLKIVKEDSSEYFYTDFHSEYGAEDALEDGDTIVLLNDLALQTAFSTSKEVTLDLNGFELSSAYSNVISANSNSAAGITIIDSVGGGKVTSTYERGYAVNGKATILGGTYTGVRGALGGGYDMIIEGGTFNGVIDSSVEIYGGTFNNYAVGSSSKILTDVSMGGSVPCSEGEAFWKVELNDDPAVTIYDEEWPALTLTIYGSGKMQKGSSPYYPWSAFAGEGDYSYLTTGEANQITRVVFADDVTVIPEYAVYKLENLKSVVVGSSVATIDLWAFWQTSLNAEFEIPASLTEIKTSYSSYWNASNVNSWYGTPITAFKVAEGNQNFSADADGVLYSKDKTVLYAWPEGAAVLKDYVIPDSTTSILASMKGQACFGSAYLSSLTFPDNDTLLADGALLPDYSYNTLENYKFGGWYKDSEFTEAIEKGNGSYPITADYKDTTVYAKWSSKLTFDVNGGNSENQTMDVVRNAKIGTLPTNPTHATLTFQSWNTKPDGSGKTVTVDTVPTGHTTYYAIWGTSSTSGEGYDAKTITVNAIPDQVYTGSAITPTVYYQVDGGNTTAYAETVNWTNNVNVGEATATITVEGQEIGVSFNITKATFDTSGITFDRVDITYDGQAHTYAITGDLPEGVTVSYSYAKTNNTPVDEMRAAANYRVTATFDVGENYNAVEPMTALYCINKVKLTIIADDKTMFVGDELPEFTYTVEGLVGEDTLTSEPTISTTATGADGGVFVLTISGGTAGSNYTMYTWDNCYVNGTLTVAKHPAPAAPAAPVIESKTDTSITVKAVAGCEYSVDGENWYGSNVLQNLTPGTRYTVYMRVKETLDTYGSAPSVTNVMTKSIPAAPTVTGSYAVSSADASKFTYTVDAIPGAVYSKDNSTWQTSNVFDGIAPSSEVTFYAKLTATDETVESAAGSVTVTFDKLVNNNVPALAYEITGESGNRTVTVIAIEGAEYKFGDDNWSTTNSKSGISADEITVQIRYQATATLEASTAASETVKVSKETQAAPAAFELTFELNDDGETYTATIPEVVGAVYSFDGVTYSETRTKSDCQSGTEYTAYVKLAETDTHNASPATFATATAPKSTVKAVTITPNGGQFSTRQSVTLACGTADAVIYYTTDGSDPVTSASRKVYTDTFVVTQTTQVRAIATKANMENSAEASAQFTSIQEIVTVSFDSMGGSAVEAVTIQRGEKVTAPTAPTKSGYTFVDWCTDSACTTVYDFNNQVAGDMTLYAKWRENSTPVAPGGNYTPSYSVTTEETENGSVKVSPSNAAVGATVTITVDPDDGYKLSDLTVLDKNGNEIKLTAQGNGKYTFKMPSGKVTVEATFVEAVTENPFVDVAENAYYYDAVLWAVENEITTGTGADTFSPNAVCTRAQVVTFLWRAAGCPEPVGAANEFDDVDSNAYYAKAVQWAVEQGITLGTGDNKFSPDAECTRGQIVTFLWRSQGSENATANNPFVDVADGAYYEDAVLWAVEEAITNGTGTDTFSPDADCTRGQIVTFLYRCLAE